MDCLGFLWSWILQSHVQVHLGSGPHVDYFRLRMCLADVNRPFPQRQNFQTTAGLLQKRFSTETVQIFS